MNIRKHMTLVVGGAICLVLLIVAVIFLFKLKAEYGREKAELSAAMKKLDGLNRREPFPSQSNLEQEEANLDTLKAYAANLEASLSAGQVKKESLEPAQFPSALEQSIRKMGKTAIENGVKLPDRFAFGFGKYAEGALPRGKDVERLVLQLKTTEQLMDILLGDRIDELLACEREVFEDKQEVVQASPVTRGRRTSRSAAPAPVAKEESDLYERERYVFRFVSSEQAFWRVLNSLAACDLFVATAEVGLKSRAPLAKKEESATGRGVATKAVRPRGITAGVTGPASESSDAEYESRSHDERVVAGREILEVEIEVDVYRFKEADAKEGEA